VKGLVDAGITPGLTSVSVVLEDLEDLQADSSAALEAAHRVVPASAVA
jgi:O-acetylhomoserine/O-acetylserine sulfhydrylase-like pyridoxal-dependent enzyme